MEVIIPCLPFHPLFSISMHNIGFLHCFQIMCSFSFQWRHKKNWTTFFSSTFCRISLLRLLNFSYINFNKHWKVLPHSENSSHSPRRLNVFVDGEIVSLSFFIFYFHTNWNWAPTTSQSHFLCKCSKAILTSPFCLFSFQDNFWEFEKL